ncbi:RNA polymerase II-associated factor 1 homolog [Tubulanus polymorphus]|uniref:RNA polymerase II-associated factor 1 homolog n=1 Tax=Tubulanus polymorphus TaxID=672921 RepID=UPI003DA613F2
MAPTVGRRDESERKSQRGEKRSELVCRVKYNNTLPDIPFDPKFITYPFESNRYVQYNQTSLERSYKHELLTEHDLGVVIDLINPDTYKIDPYANLDPEDEKLLEEDYQGQNESKRSRHHNKNVSWLRKTEYISTEYNRFTQSASKVEARIGYSIKKSLTEDHLYKDRDSQIQAIENTFEEAKKPITAHYSKPNVYPIDVLPVFPDFEMWKHPCAQVIFDTDPAPKGIPVQAQMQEMSQAMIRGMTDESGDQFVAYFLPTEDTITKRKRDSDEAVDYKSDDEYEYTLSREYNWNVKNKASRGYEETYFFVLKDDAVYYNELETRVRLSKRRKIAGAPQGTSKLIVTHRPLNQHELRAQEIRRSMLDAPGEEEEEDMGDEFGIKSDEEKGQMDQPGSGDEEQNQNDAEDKNSDAGSDDEAAGRKNSPARSRSGSESDHEDRTAVASDNEDNASVASSRGSNRGSDNEKRNEASDNEAASNKGSDDEKAASASESDDDDDDRRTHKQEEEIFGSGSSGAESD